MEIQGEKRKAGRPRGVRFDRKVQVRIPHEMLAVLKQLSAKTGRSVGQLVRQGIEARLSPDVRQWIQTVKSYDKNPRERLAAIKKIRRVRRAVLACIPLMPNDKATH